ncbi:MAG: iron-containing alcohol dehydrogenase [Crocinitomicaceae bacterium]|nr:iron-containing alcohol dehydrogenase [Crocinitomicaceae bacterium]
MLNFEVVNPTRIIFGKNQLDRLPQLLDDLNVKRVMIAFGGGSVMKYGLMDKLIEKLTEFEIIYFGGIEANPEFSTLMKGVELARKERVDFILAVGGGSVIDGVKFMSGAITYPNDPWEVLDRKEGCVFEQAIPFGTILTLPATGSEANSGAVISRTELKQKRTMGGPLFFPVFSFCDPSLIATLPKRQLVNGIIDAYMHTLEQYLTYPSDNLLQEREAEGILSTLIEITDVVENPNNYRLASNLMHCATHALNGNLRCGVPTDWTTHMIGHELTAFYGIDHARTLAIIAPRLYENRFEEKQEKLTQYGKRVFGLVGNDLEIAKEAIVRTEALFNGLGVSTKLSEHTVDYDGAAEKVKNVFIERGWTAMGERQSITPDTIEMIVKSAY